MSPMARSKREKARVQGGCEVCHHTTRANRGWNFGMVTQRSFKAWTLLTIVIVNPIFVTWWIGQHNARIWFDFKSYPIIGLNILLFFFMDLQLYLISIFERSTWLIDPLWPVIPLLINGYFFTLSEGTLGLRPLVLLIILILWSIRLQHNYLRKEQWELGKKEDWRYADMRKKYGRRWIWIQFIVVELVQHALLFGVSYPMWPVYRRGERAAGEIHIRQSGSGLNRIDLIALFVCSGSLFLAKYADDVLDNFLSAKRDHVVPASAILTHVPWNWCRHPNHLGELMFWFGVGLSGVAAGASPFVLTGAVLNALCLVATVNMVERRMEDPFHNSPAKLAQYAEYKRCVKAKLIPLVW
eukprot:Blabericola_migrator_1__6148@NODE_30_length_19081_cov_136_854686_g26_i0_p6_GENE_NODE_30_length_19081_cov_136_854686_g26_i0NODE_30_length_19081_cov_136_854686_g26_i0_p6_ORF_typecomplete_len355_score44_43DUF1295/PF06966_12/5_9e41ERG4_ERG24/PF01222_17/3_4e03ERG4_ERG24/PF01222_17/6_3e03ERG4_ERG24/PF01222_17/5_1e07PEMT/PF04191_13/6_1e03PEMT/PF04191_13/1_5e03PEMT/PF04191_13/3_6e06ICMT/PF04140_14/5e03ICMT/PF04140_14/8_7e03ICMT/PF04140_14/7_9e05DUF979/PF06166_12/1_5e03DUF979/PF06166_12/0_17Steroid_dh/PF